MQKHKQVSCLKFTWLAKYEWKEKNSREEGKQPLKHKQQAADADSVIVWIGDRLVEY